MALPLFVGRSLVRGVLVVIGAAVVVFIVTHMVGDPVAVILPLNATHGQYLALRHQLGLDHAFPVLFFDYFKSLAHGDFGQSYWQREPAMRVALGHIWPTVELALVATVLSTLTGVPAGFVAAMKADGAVDRAVSGVAVLAVSIATFWLALMLILVFAVELGWFPTSGYGLANLVLPALAAAALPFGRVTQLARAAMLDELDQPYMRVARAKGLSLASAVVRHATRNALIGVVTFVGFEFAFLVGAGMIVIESIFNWPGIGNLTYQALQHRDVPLIEACVMLIAVLVVLTNTAVDVLYGAIDPRTRT